MINRCTDNSGPILIVAMSAASFMLLREAAFRFARRGEKVAFLATGEDAKLDQAMHQAAKTISGRVFTMADYFTAGKQASKQVGHLKDGNSRLGALLDYHYVRLRAAEDLLAHDRPRAIVVAEDGISGNCWIIEAARRAGIPIVDCPYGYGTSRDLEGDLARKQRNGELVTLAGQYADEIRSRSPQWIKCGQFEGALMYAPEYIVARERLGISIRNPWIIHGGFSDTICVESRQMLRHYSNEGISGDRLVLTGTTYCDVMFDALENAEAARMTLHTNRKIAPHETSILVSWPPSYHADRGALCEFASYPKLSQAVFEFLALLDNVRVTISLHPAISEEFRPWIPEDRVTLSKANLIELIPQHDIYITEFSSTIRWAVAAGKPVVNYDFYAFDLIDYAEAPGVLTVKNFAEFSELVCSLAENEDRYAEAALLQTSVAAEWGMIDGQATDNVLAVIRSFG